MTLKSLNSVMPQVNLLMFSPLLLWLCNPPPAESRARPAEKQSLFHFFNFQSETDLPSGHWDSFNRGDLCWEVGQHLQMVVIYVELWSLLLRKCSTFDSEKHNSGLLGGMDSRWQTWSGSTHISLQPPQEERLHYPFSVGYPVFLIVGPLAFILHWWLAELSIQMWTTLIDNLLLSLKKSSTG